MFRIAVLPAAVTALASAVQAALYFEDDDALSLLQLRANHTSNDEVASMWKHGQPRNTPSWFWRNGGCVTNLGGDLKFCRVYSDTHLQVFGTTANTQYHGNGPQVIARTKDDSVRIDGFQCPFHSGEGAMNAIVVKMGDHIIECTKPPDCNTYLYCKIDGELVHRMSLPKMWESGLYVEKHDYKQICIDSPDGKSSVTLRFRGASGNCEIMKFLTWYEADIRFQGDNAVTDDNSLCAGSTSPLVTMDQTLFSTEAASVLCDQCPPNRWTQGGSCAPYPPPPPPPTAAEVCAENGKQLSDIEAYCQPLAGHAGRFQGCLVDACATPPEREPEIIEEDIEADEEMEPGPTCVDTANCDLSDTCSQAARLSTANIVQNNLAGAGPDAGAEELRYGNAVAVGGKVLDLVVKVVGGQYTGKAAQNGNKGEFGKINMNSGSNVDLEFSFVDSATNEPYTLESVALSFYDLDEGRNAKSRTTITGCGADNAVVTTDTELTLARPDGCYAISSSQHGTAANNPDGPAGLTEDQASRSVTYTYGAVDRIRVNMALGKGWGYRNTMFSLQPTLPCLAGADPNLPTLIEPTRDPDAPSEDTCPFISRGDGCMWNGGENSVTYNGYGAGDANLQRCHDACANGGRLGAIGKEFNGFSHNGYAGGSATCECEREQATMQHDEDPDAGVTVFCPAWRPYCNLAIFMECKTYRESQKQAMRDRVAGIRDAQNAGPSAP